MPALRCRDHPEIAVTWKGTGCWICDRPRRKRPPVDNHLDWNEQETTDA